MQYLSFYMVKFLLIILIFLFGKVAFSQYSIDSKVKFEFDSLFNIQPKKVQQIRNMEAFENGFALLLKMEEDTLNRHDFLPIINDIKILSVDEDWNVIPDEPKDTLKYNQFLFVNAAFINDTLDIASFIGPFSGYVIYVKLIGDKTFGNFMEYEDKLHIYQKELSDPKSSEVRVKARVKSVQLSEIPKNPGDIFYGKVALTTAPFYLDDNNFKNGYIHKQYSIVYLFTCKLADAHKKWQ